ncbi:hypothetical protein FEQ05_05115 [Burkholderia pseudomultivorans]|uniref:Transposase IS204/IS1001/IS1096/IS1165 DDE domain-containing protein n=1 Tax=Burkholderia pseudomultivorans TaxID=1207504 RepID=A0ABU2ED53_9BURK|nr:hypothetical protein [Burkholderia pseudomultivorans]TCT27166.1 transposase [Burkholderia vietnamiensis]MDR8738765.1 hypothetical protein [Burkholderia pseudomultivorans]MDR8745402.1 hypothetical protein [Burkholderia pseudomultivorans]MDR8757504.1 hypothetical protein [Burkholderia pseudomultivorans]
MTTAYELEIKANCSQAEIAYDLFHVIAKHGREVIDRMRVDQANQLRHDLPAQKLLKSSRWLLRDELKLLWFYRRAVRVQKAWEHWIEHAKQSGIAALELFAQRLQGSLCRNSPGRCLASLCILQ